MNTIVIQFIGLLMFTGHGGVARTARHQITNPAYYAVADGRSALSQRYAQGDPYQVTVIAPKVPAGVDAHTAMVLWKGTPLSVSGWQVNPLGSLSSGWSYIVLSHDSVEFVSDTANPSIGPKLSNVAIPKVQRDDGQVFLQTAYMAPSYADTAAVFNMRSGTLNSCAAGTRIDTTLTLKVQTKLTIKAGNKSLVLPATAQVAIANVPWTYADKPNNYQQTGMDHSMTYCALLGGDCSMTHPVVTNGCAYFVPPPAAKHTEKTQGSDFACSNTQWP